MSQKTIITAALNGSTVHRGQCPTVPYTPAEIAAEAQRAVDAGAAIVHVHAREEGGAPSYRVERYRELLAAVRERCSGLVSVSTGMLGVGLDERAIPLEARPDLATLPVGTLTVARFNERTRSFDFDHVMANPFAAVTQLASRAAELGIHVVPTCYDVGHISSVDLLSRMGQLPGAANLYCNLTLGVMGGIPAHTTSLCHMAATMPAGGSWCTTTPGKAPWRLFAGALSLGGHLRVGFEDGHRLPNGEAAESNGNLVEAAAALIRAAGLVPASADEARQMLDRPAGD